MNHLIDNNDSILSRHNYYNFNVILLPSDLKDKPYNPHRFQISLYKTKTNNSLHMIDINMNYAYYV